MSDTSSVIVAVIAAAGVVLSTVLPILIGLRRARAENAADHGRVRDSLDALTQAQVATHGEVQAIGDRLNDHITDHRTKGAA